MDRKLGDKRRVTPANWHVFVATPAYDGKVDCDYSQSLAEASFCCPLFQVKLTASVMGNGAFIELARNVFCKQFLEMEEFQDCSHLFFIDADLKFPQHAFIGLIRSGLPICAGVYRRRQEPEEYPAKWSENPNGGGLWVENDFLMCDRVPTGFLCISRKVLEEMAVDAPKIKIHGQEGYVPWLFYTKLSIEGGCPDQRFVGEDFSFCDDYRKKYGQPIPVWPDINFVHGGYEGNFHHYLNRKIEEQESLVSSVA